MNVWRNVGPLMAWVMVSVSACFSPQSVRAAPRAPLSLRYPLAAQPSVSSSFGTYRINHHHAGLDLCAPSESTQVLAAAAGQIIKIRRSGSGFGRVIYLQHRGGWVTVYAHLSAFAPRLEALIARQERRRPSFELTVRPRDLQVEAGEPLGWIGSSGTDLIHLHFELRQRNTPVNPLRNGLQLPDTISPELPALRLSARRGRDEIEGDHKPRRIPLVGEPTITISGEPALELEAFDRIDGSARRLTPYRLRFFIDERLRFEARYDQSSYAEKRYTELDFSLLARQEGRLAHHLSRLGPRLRVHRRSERRPLRRLSRGLHQARVVAEDAAGNERSLRFTLQVSPPAAPPLSGRRRSLAYRHRGAELISGEEWRATGFTFPLPLSFAEGALDYDVRLSGQRLPSSALRLCRLAGRAALSVDLPQPSALQSILAARRTRARGERSARAQRSADEGREEAPLRVEVTLQRRGEQRGARGARRSLFLETALVEPERRWRHRRSLSLTVGEEATFSPYYTRLEELPSPASIPSEFKAVSPLFRFRNGWLPMRAASEVELPRGARRPHQGAYLHDRGRWWWVTRRWSAQSISAGSVHLSEFAILEDQVPPRVGTPYWSAHPAGPRLVVPFREEGSGLSRLALTLDGEPLIIELQRAWRRALWTPRARPRGRALRVELRDRSGHRSAADFSLPPPPELGWQELTQGSR